MNAMKVIMAKLNGKSIALKWYFFASGSYTVCDSFFHLIMKVYGFSPRQIGSSNSFGVQHLMLPFLFLLADKFRARRLLSWFVALGSVIVCTLPLLPLVVSLPSCFGPKIKLSPHSNQTQQRPNGNGSTNLHSANGYDVPWTSALYIVMAISRSFVIFFGCSAFSLSTMATFCYLGKDKANYGVYFMWKSIGNCILMIFAAVLAWRVKVSVCGVEVYSYFVCFLLGGIFLLSSFPTLPFLQFTYDDHRTIDCTDVKGVVCHSHYIYLYALNLYIGICSAFQYFWEFWYIHGFTANPLVMGGVILVRSPSMAVSIYASRHIIRRIGELYTICISLLIFSAAFLALSFTQHYWSVIVIDAFQGIAYGLATSAINVHFSKAGSKTSSGVVFGILETCLMFGIECGASLLGFLFQAMGTEKTLMVLSGMTSVVSIVLLLYLEIFNKAKENENIQHVSSDDEVSNDDDYW